MFDMTEHDFNRLRNDVRAIKDALLGEGTHKNNGLIDRQCKTEKRILAVERALWTAGGVVMLIAFIGGIITVTL